MTRRHGVHPDRPGPPGEFPPASPPGHRVGERTPDVSVIVVVHNGIAHVDRCLASVLAQTGVDLEVIVVDNASSDGSLEQVRRLFPSVCVVASSANLGYAGGINVGLRRARGRFITALNVDTVVEPGCFARLAEVLACSKDVGAVTPLLLIDEDRGRVNAMGGAIHVTGLSFCNGLNQPKGAVPAVPFSVPGFSGACFMIRRDLLERVGGAPDHCFMGNDDVVLSWWVRLAGADIQCVPGAVVYHRYGLTLDTNKLFLVERNRLDLLLTSMDWRTLLLLAPAGLAIELAILVYCGARGREHLEAKLAAYRAVWAWRRDLLSRRRRVQGFREVSDRVVLSRLRLVPEWRQLATLLLSKR